MLAEVPCAVVEFVYVCCQIRFTLVALLLSPAVHVTASGSYCCLGSILLLGFLTPFHQLCRAGQCDRRVW